MQGLIGSILAEPRQAASRSRWDLVMVVATLLGGLQRDGGVLGVALPVAALAALVWFRKSMPLGACALGLAVAFATLHTVDPGRSASMVGVLILIFGLSRWASGRDVLLGLIAILAIGPSISSIDAAASFGEADPLAVRTVSLVITSLVETMIWLAPFGLGLIVRNRAGSHARDVLEARSKERDAFARELHDTVAHHVSAIAIAAQAGQAVAPARQEAAVEALASIEEEATRTLDEMRRMVRTLRTADDDVELAPQAGLRQIETLAEPDGSPQVNVEIAGDLDALSPSVEASLFRIAQEATTNARRHARDARRIDIRVDADTTDVRLVVADDGRKPAVNDRPAGFGLVGMAERVALLDGTFAAAPGKDRGWVVEATLPRSGVPS